jgi:8-oxo-dGTP pyrophosphatase MutT (NUDIX family)
MTRVIATEMNREGAIYTDETRTIILDDNSKIVRDVIIKRPCVVALVKDVSTSTPFAVLVNEFRVGTMKNENGFPAGIVDEGEEPIQAIVREVIEETGMIPVKVEYLGDSYTSSGFTNEHIHHFYVEVDGKNQKEQELDHDEQITLVHIPFNDVFGYIESGKLVGSHAHACLLKYILKHYDLVN